MKKILLFILIAFTVFAGNNCTKNILQKVNLNGLPSAQVWSDSTLAVLYLNSLYGVIMPVWPCNENTTSTFPTSFHNVSDESNGGTATLLQGKLTTESVADFFTSATAGSWAYMRRINMLFANIDNYGLKPSQTALTKAQAHFLRAYIYFDLFKLYGGVPYVTNPQDYLLDSLNVPRLSSSAMVDSIVAELNQCSVLPATWLQSGQDFGRITRGAALAFKSRVLLTWASPQFNPTNDMSRWQAALTAAKNAYDTCTMDGYALYPTFGRISIDAGVATNHEPLIFRPFNGSAVTGQFEGYDGVTRPFSMSAGSGGTTNNPTWNLVQAFPMKDGRPTNDVTGTFAYDSVYYWHNRDPRFYQTIVYNGAFYGLAGTPQRKQWMYQNITVDKGHLTTTGFYARKNIDTSISNVNSQYGKAFWVELRFAEVLMNLAECANATGDQATASTMLAAIRKRAGITNADGNYGVPKSVSQDSMQSFINTEREVEFAFEGRRYDDLRRTRGWDKLNGQFRQQIVIAFKSTYNITAMETINPATGTAPIDTINVDGPDYTKYFTHTFTTLTGDLAINFLPTYYAYALPSSNISKDPNLQQTLGWLFGTAPGTFDPTK